MMDTYERPEPPLPDTAQVRLLIILEHVAFGEWKSRHRLRDSAKYALEAVVRDVEREERES